MRISNNYIRRILDSCDLIGILGRILACVGVIGKLTYPLPKLGEGRVRVHSDIRITCHAELCLTAFSEISDFVKNVWFSTAFYQRGVDNFNVNTFLKQIYTFITGQMLSQAQNDTKGMTSADHSCHAELDSASDQRRMDKFSVSRHCEHSEAIQEEMVSNRLLRRFTPRNDNEKAGVK